MRASLIQSTLAAIYNGNKRSVCIEGAPGGGKTTIVRDTAAAIGVDYRELHMPTMLVEDFGILYPSADSEQLSYKLPEWWPMDPESKGILCFDDRNQASADLQKVLANIIQARSLHGYSLPDGWMVVSTGNRASDRAGANRVLSHLRNRETVIEYEVHVMDWSSWAVHRNVHPTVISFLNFNTALLHDFDPQRDINPTPRSWVEGVDAMLGVVPREAEYECFKGAVGEGAAAEFTGYLKIYRQLPDPREILLNPDKASVPSDPMTLYALVGSLADFATKDNLGQIVQYLDRLPQEFSVLCITLATRSKPELCGTKAFTSWAANCKVLF
jgi:hypothetical protein